VAGTITIKGTPVSKQYIARLCINSLVSWIISIGFWYAVSTYIASNISTSSLAITTAIIANILTFTILSIRFHLTWKQWIHIWTYVTPWTLASIMLFPQFPLFPILSALVPTWLLVGLWGIYRFTPFDLDTRLHRARYSNPDEKTTLSTNHPHTESLLVGVNQLSYWYPKTHKQFYCVQSKPSKPELGNMLVCAPTRSGKGLLAKSQLLAWKYSVVVNDPKGELFHATSGGRDGKTILIDATGFGHRFDPLQGKYTEHELRLCAKELLYIPDEKDPIFTKRAINMLTQLFLAARKANHPPFPFVLELINKGLPDAAAIINTISSEMATGLLYTSFEQAKKDNFSNRFLNSAWETLATTMKELLTDELIKVLAGSDFDPEELMLSEKPVTIYLKWKEEDLLVLAPMIRLTWNTIIRRLITTYDTRKGEGCKPVLMLVDEAANPPIPALAQYAATAVGRRIYFQIYIQSLAQLDAEYGVKQADTIKANIDTWLVYRQNDLATANYFAERIGYKSAWAHSFNRGETTGSHQERSSQGLSEQKVFLTTPQEIMQLPDQKIIAFHRNLPPIKMHRMDWRRYDILNKRHNLPIPTINPLPPVPQLAFLPALADISAPAGAENLDFQSEYIDPDLLQSRR